MTLEPLQLRFIGKAVSKSCFVGKHKLPSDVKLLAVLERVRDLTVHLPLEDGVVKEVEDHRVALLIGVLEDTRQVMSKFGCRICRQPPASNAQVNHLRVC